MSSANVIRFPMRCAACIRLMREASGTWLVLAYSHGWVHGDRNTALADARWLSQNFGLPVREDQREPNPSGERSP
jgi:hypothetical protein